jgi:hypothetical protein
VFPPQPLSALHLLLTHTTKEYHRLNQISSMGYDTLKSEPLAARFRQQKALGRLAVFRLQALFVFNLFLTPSKQYHAFNLTPYILGDTLITALLQRV